MAILFLIVFIGLLGFGIILPLFPFYAERLGATPQLITWTMAGFTLGQLFAAPVWGRLSDAYGRRLVLVLTLLGQAIGYVVLAYATELWLVIASRVFGGIMAGNVSAAFAYVSDVTTAKTRAAGMGKVSAGLGLGFMFGPAIGGLLAGPEVATANYVLPALAAAGIALTAMLATLWLLPESLRQEHRRPLFDRSADGGAAGLRETLRALLKKSLPGGFRSAGDSTPKPGSPGVAGSPENRRSESGAEAPFQAQGPDFAQGGDTAPTIGGPGVAGSLESRRSELAGAAPSQAPAADFPQGGATTAARLRPLLLVGCVFFVAMSLMESIFPLWANHVLELGPRFIGSVFFVIGSIQAAIQGLLIAPLTTALGEKRLALVGATLFGLGLGGLSLTAGPATMWASITLFGLGVGVITPCLSSLVSQAASPDRRGAVMGQYQAASALGRVIGPGMSGLLYAKLGAGVPFALAALLMLPVLALVGKLRTGTPGD